MKKYLAAGLLSLVALTASAFTNEECSIAATNVYYAQKMLNEDPKAFEEVTVIVRKTPASEYGMTDSLKAYILSFIDRMKAGKDEQVIGQAVFDACRKIKTM